MKSVFLINHDASASSPAAVPSVRQKRKSRATISSGLRVVLSLLSLGSLPAVCTPSPSAAEQASPSALGEVSVDWQDERGEATRFSRWEGKTLLLTMAYSTCRQVCSLTLHRLEELQLSADRAGIAIEVVVISYDPTVDGPGSWSSFRRRHHLDRANWHFLTGSAANTRRFATAMRFPYWSYDDHLVHDFKILLIGPDGRMAKTLTWATRNDELFAVAAGPCTSANLQGCAQ